MKSLDKVCDAAFTGDQIARCDTFIRAHTDEDINILMEIDDAKLAYTLLGAC